LRTLVLLSLLLALFAGLSLLFDPTTAAAVLAVAIVLSFWSYWSVLPDFIASTDARLCDDPPILAAATELALRAGIPARPIYVVEDPQPNALALGSSVERSAVILTSGLCSALPDEEIKAVLAHELAHIRNRDVFAATLGLTFVQAILSLAALLGLVALLLDRRARPAVAAIALLGPLVALILRCALSRSAEYRADRDAAFLCGGPEPLICALRHLAQLTAKRRSRIAALSPAMASLFIVDPTPSSWLASLLAPHPPIERRVERLERDFLLAAFSKRR
jgi:heat shock protein HtpX